MAEQQKARTHRLNYARSGHKMRVAQVEARRSRAVSAPPARRKLAVLSALLALPLVVATAAAVHARWPAPHAGTPPVVAAAPMTAVPVVAPVVVPPVAPVVEDRHIDGKIEADEVISTALARVGVSTEDRSALVRQLTDHLDARGIRAGAPFTCTLRPNGELARFELKALSSTGIPRNITAERQPDPITVETDGPVFAVAHEDAPVVVDVAGIAGTVGSSLYQSFIDAGEDAVLVEKFVDIFAWNIDFYRQTRKGDTFKVLVEKRTAGGRFLGYGRVVAAEYVNAGTVHRGFPFVSADGKHTGTYDEDGAALMKTFLKSPMEVARITSSYGMRFHPILNTNKKHDGVDYGAAIGTPVWSVADGTVETARYNGGAGNMVLIKHMNGLETEYFHLSKFAEGMKPGAHVKQKQVIGYVGSTGLSTGPHLHFGMLKNDTHVDPQKQAFPTARPVPDEYAKELHDDVAPLLARLSGLDRV